MKNNYLKVFLNGAGKVTIVTEDDNSEDDIQQITLESISISIEDIGDLVLALQWELAEYKKDFPDNGI